MLLGRRGGGFFDGMKCEEAQDTWNGHEKSFSGNMPEAANVLVN